LGLGCSGVIHFGKISQIPVDPAPSGCYGAYVNGDLNLLLSKALLLSGAAVGF
jgi:hypothetical protein